MQRTFSRWNAQFHLVSGLSDLPDTFFCPQRRVDFINLLADGRQPRLRFLVFLWELNGASVLRLIKSTLRHGVVLVRRLWWILPAA